MIMVTKPQINSASASGISLLLVWVLFSALLSAQTSDDGWNFLAQNKLAKARDVFEKSAKSNSSDVRAWLGLTYEADLRDDTDESWRAYNKAMHSAPQSAPYLFATINSQRFFRASVSQASAVEALLREAVNIPDKQGITRAMAIERLGSLAEQNGNLDEARSWYNKLGAISTWRIIGPFENTAGSGYDRLFAPEVFDDTAAVYAGTDGGEVRWQTPPAFRVDRWIDLTLLTHRDIGQFYALVYIKSPTQQRVQLRLGTSGSFKMFLNDSLVRSTYDEFNNDLDTYITECTIAAGWNKVLVKVGASEINRCNFLLRITDASGIPLTGLEFSTTPQKFALLSAQASVVGVEHMDYFRNEIKAHPSRIENYLLLAECHLRNDEVHEAMKALRAALEIAPDCMVVNQRLLEVYQRSARADDHASLITHISTTLPDLPMSMNHRINEALEQDQLNAADSLLAILKRRDSTSMMYFDVSMVLARRRNAFQDFVDLAVRAFEHYPQSSLYAGMASGVAKQASQKYDDAIAVMKRHLEVVPSANGLVTLAQLYTESGDRQSAELVYETIESRWPAQSGYVAQRADAAINRKDWQSALQHMQRAIILAPNLPGLWYKLGIVQKNLGNASGAIASIQRCIAIDPASFTAREMLRDLQGQPHPFTYMPVVDVDSIMRNAPPSSAYPNDNAIYLFDAKRRVSYDGSRSEVQIEWAARVYTVEGLDDFKEVYTPRGGQVMVERAIVRKANGREFPADKGPGQLVFKNLEVGDIVYVRYRYLEADSGRLAPYFADSYAFNSRYPCLYSQYIVLSTKSQPFQWRADGFDSDMILLNTPAGEMSIWETRNEPGIEHEDGMPDRNSINKRISISSIPNWEEISGWFNDFVSTRTRTSAEVRETMDSLFIPGRGYTREDIIKGVYQYVTQQIRYSYVPFRQSGFVPQRPEKVLRTRIGDCKDVVSLFIAMLAERNIKAYPVLVQTQTPPLQRRPLPSLVFDHVIAMIPGDSLPLFLDLTAENMPIGSLPYADINAFALVIKRGLREPTPITREYLIPNTLSISTRVELKEDLSAIISQLYVEHGTGTQAFRSAWRNKSEKDRNKELIEMLSRDYPDVELLSVDHDDVTELTPSFSISIRFSVPNYAMEAGGFIIVRILWEDALRPDAALSYEKRKYPIEMGTRRDTLSETVIINVPRGFVVSNDVANLSLSTPALSYSRSTTLSKDEIRLTRTVEHHRPYILVEEYPHYRVSYNKMVKEDRRSLLFMPKGTVVKLPKTGAR